MTGSTRHALVLAAGAGVRFGGRKLLTPWRGAPLVLAAVRTALAAPVDGVVVVVGSDGEAVGAALAPLDGPRLQVVAASDWREGLAASLRAGVGALPADSRAVVVFLADMPLVPPDLATRLLDALDAGALAAEVRFRGAPAHPVAFSVALYPGLAALQGDRGARGLLAGLSAVAVVDCEDPGCMADVDTPADLAALQRGRRPSRKASTASRT